MEGVSLNTRVYVLTSVCVLSSPKLGFFADFLYIALLSPVGNYIKSENVTWDEER